MTQERVRVTSTRTTAPRRSDRSLVRDLDEQTGLGDVLLRGLMRAQLRLAVTVLGVGSVLTFGMPVVFALIPIMRQARILGVPLPWLLLSVVIYPTAFLVSRYFVGASERVEKQFTEVTATPATYPTPWRRRRPRRGGRDE